MKAKIKRFISSTILICFAVLVCYSSTAFSAVPEIINYQGSLSDDVGNPVNATLNITFTLYDDQLAGSTLWQEVQPVTVINGQFSVQFGADGGNPLDPSLFENPIFLGVQVDADAEMTPRQPITAVGYAFRSKTVENDTLNSLSCAANEIPKFIGGVWACAVDTDTDTDTTYSAGNGLVLNGTSFSVNTNVVQNRVSGTCAVGSSIRAIAANGTVTCEVDTDTNTNAATLCPNGTFLNGDGTCDIITDTNTNAATICPDGSYLKGNGTCRDIGPHRYSGTVPVGGTVTIGNGIFDRGQIVRITFGDRIQQSNYTLFTGMANDGNTALKGFVLETGSTIVRSLRLITTSDTDQYVAVNGYGVLRGSGTAGSIKLRNNHPTLQLFYIAVFGPSSDMLW